MDWTDDHDREFNALMKGQIPAHEAVVRAARNTREKLVEARYETDMWRQSAQVWQAECAKTRRLLFAVGVVCAIGWGLALIQRASVVWGD